MLTERMLKYFCNKLSCFISPLLAILTKADNYYASIQPDEQVSERNKYKICPEFPKKQ